MMRLVGFAIVVLMWTVLVIATVNLIFDWVRDRRLSKYEQSEKRVNILLVQETLRKARRTS